MGIKTTKKKFYTEVRGDITESLEEFLSGEKGWCIIVDNQGELQRWDRPANPCLGGNIRKYKRRTVPQNYGHIALNRDSGSDWPDEDIKSRTIGHDDYTDPYTGNLSNPSDDYFPGDLKYRFPDGKPVAFAKTYPRSVYDSPMTDLILNDSPFRSGLPSKENIHMTPRGLILTDLSVDSTVFIQALGQLQYMSVMGPKILSVIDDPMDALFLSYLFYGYQHPISIDVQRFYEKNPHDLTGGKLSERYDYNRKILHEIFGDHSVNCEAKTGNVSKKNRKFSWSKLAPTGFSVGNKSLILDMVKKVHQEYEEQKSERKSDE